MVAMTTYLIDASIYIFQAHFSPYVECQDENGEDISALYGFAQFLLQFINRAGADHLAVDRDESLFCGFRHQLCQHYKSNRELPDPNLARQLVACDEFSRLLGVPTFSSRVYEADDIIGTLARRIREATGSDITVVSRDKDLAQVLKGNGDLLRDFHANRKRDIEALTTDMGVRPDQLPDYLGLVGDAVDRISGVPGIGPVKGRELLRCFETLDGIYDNLPQVQSLALRGAGKLAALLEAHRDQAYLCRRLATIVDDVHDPAEPFSVLAIEELARNHPPAGEIQSFMKHQHMDARTRSRLSFLWNEMRDSSGG